MNYITDLEEFILNILKNKEIIAEKNANNNSNKKKYLIKFNKYLKFNNNKNSEKKRNLTVERIRNIIENIY